MEECDNKKEFEHNLSEKIKKDIEMKQTFKEYYSQNYYLKIIFENEFLTITVYNLNTLDGIRYERFINSHDLASYENIKKYNLKEIYDKFIISFNENKYEFQEEGGNFIKLKIYLQNNENKEEKIEIKLDISKKNILDEHNKILIHEIKKLRENNDIISKLNEENKIIKTELEDLGKKILEYKNENLIKKKVETKEKRILELVNCDQKTELNICDKKYGNEIIEALKKIDLDELKELRLYNDNISQINKLEELKIEKLKILGLNDNKISDISILGSIKFDSLEELWLSNNTITNINILEKCNFKTLIKLDLSSNNISDLSILEKTDLSNLKELWLYKNLIKDIKPLEKGNFYHLEKLDLSINLISDISIFATDGGVFDELKYLDLSHNIIVDISCFQDIKRSGLIFLFSKGILNYINDLFLINNRIDYGRNIEIINRIESLGINFKF